MKKVDFEANTLEKQYGLSCVEEIILFLLDINAVPYACLFYDAAISLGEIEAIFLSNQCNFATFARKNTLQDIAIREGFLSIRFADQGKIPTEDNGYYCCVMVDPRFAWERYHTRLLRADHYILLSPKENGYTYFNNSPRDINVLTDGEIDRYYVGRTIEIKIEDPIIQPKEYYLNKFRIAMNESNTFPQRSLDCICIEQYRDMVGILKIYRRRLSAFLSMWFDVSFMSPYCKMLEQDYALLEYLRLRGQENLPKFREIVQEIHEADREMMERIEGLIK